MSDSRRRFLGAVLVLIGGATLWWAVLAADRGALPTRTGGAATVEGAVREAEAHLAAATDESTSRTSAEVAPCDVVSDLGGGTAPAPLVAAPEHMIRVLVTDQRGAPVEAARVEFDLRNAVTEVVSTDASGLAVIAVPEVYEGVRFRVRHHEYATLVDSVDVTDPIVAVLRSPCALTVWCVEAGTGAPLADVDVEWSMDGSGSSGRSRTSARSDVRGQVSFDDVPTNARIRLLARGVEVYLQALAFETTDAPSESRTFVMRRGEPIRLRVFDERTHAPIAPTLIRDSQGREFGWRAEPDGALTVFAFFDEWRELGRVDLHVEADGHAASEMKAPIDALKRDVHVPMRELMSVAFECDGLVEVLGPLQRVTLAWGRSLRALTTRDWCAPFEPPPGDDEFGAWNIRFACSPHGPPSVTLDDSGVAVVAGLLHGFEELQLFVEDATGATTSGTIEERITRGADGADRFRVSFVDGPKPKLAFTRVPR
jgi:hypothetical protein